MAAEGFIRPSYSAAGGAHKATHSGKFHGLDTNRTLVAHREHNELKYQQFYTQPTPLYGPMNGREAPESGHRLNVSNALNELKFRTRFAFVISIP